MCQAGNVVAEGVGAHCIDDFRPQTFGAELRFGQGMLRQLILSVVCASPIRNCGLSRTVRISKLRSSTGAGELRAFHRCGFSDVFHVSTWRCMLLGP